MAETIEWGVRFGADVNIHAGNEQGARVEALDYDGEVVQRAVGPWRPASPRPEEDRPTTETIPLDLPESTYEALNALGDIPWDSWAHMDEAARRIAAPVVAAELRRQADSLDEWAATPAVLPNAETLHVAAARLRARADQLDGGTQ